MSEEFVEIMEPILDAARKAGILLECGCFPCECECENEVDDEQE